MMVAGRRGMMNRGLLQTVEWGGVPSRLAVLTVLSIAGGAGCAQAPTAQPAVQSQSETSHAAVVDSSAPQTADAPLMPLKEIIVLTENGQDDQARAALKTFLKKEPKNPQALSLQRQLTTDPRVLMGAHVVKYTVQNGDTLGGLAQKYLGSSLKFVALARYNHIQRSRDLRVGQVIEVPDISSAVSAPAASAILPVAPVPQNTEPAASVAAEKSAEATPPAVVAPKATPKAAPGLIEPPVVKASVAAHAPTADAKALEQSGMVAYKQKQWEAAYTALSSAVLASPGIEPATSTLATLKPKLVRQYHEQALVDFRQQQLNQAIALWDKALAIDPNYEPALGYRARALELQRRLNQLEKR